MSTASAGPCVLLTIPISHYCERARWALDRAGIAYRERAHLQMIHWVAVRRAGGSGTVPVLVCGDRVLSDSADIVEYASSRMPEGSRLYPADLTAADEVRTLERDFAENLGPDGRLWMYHSLHGRRDLALAYGCTGVPRWEREALRVAYPILIRGIDHFLKVTPEAAVSALAQVRASFDAVAERLAGRRYLCGDSFTAADLTFAALAAPMLMPPQYGVALPQPPELPAGMAEVVRELRAHPAGEHALAMFRDERGRRVIS